MYHTTLSHTQDTLEFGERIGRALVGGERIVLVGDLGAGKTTLVKGIAKGMGIEQTVQSPSYALSLTYMSPHGLELNHYDLYRLQDLALIQYEIDESSNDPRSVLIVEWAERLPDGAMKGASTVTLSYTADDEGREASVTGSLAVLLGER